jgi:PAS domain S-box-containing protein
MLDLNHPIEAAQKHVERLHQRAAAEPARRDEVLSETFQELHNMLEQLRVAEDQLSQQNEQLAAAHARADAERQRYRDLFDFAPDAYLVTNAEGSILEANRAATALLRFPAEGLRHKPLIVFVAEQERCAFRDLLARLEQEPGVRDKELRIQPRGAPSFPASVQVAAVRDVGGRLTGLRWLVRDIRARKQAEEALRRQRDFAETLIATAGAAVLVLDRDGRVVRLNPYLEELSGRCLDEVKGLDWFEVFLRPPDREAARDRFLGRVPGTDGGIIVYPLVTRTGAEREVHWSTKPLLDAAGNVSIILAVGHDITDLKEAQQRALQAERLAAIGQMVSGLSHEGRNALQRSQACLEMLALDVQDRPAALDLVTRVQRAQEHLHDLYEAVRVYAAPLVPKPRPCDLGEALRQAWGQLEWLRRGRAATLHTAPDAPDLHTLADPDLMVLVFRNILANALSACPDPATITVCWSEPDGARLMLRAAVRDNGPGLTPEQARRIFEPFYTTKAHGIGLGMALAKRIVEAHDGHITVGPDGGPGAEILVSLPRRLP